MLNPSNSNQPKLNADKGSEGSGTGAGNPETPISQQQDQFAELSAPVGAETSKGSGSQEQNQLITMELYLQEKSVSKPVAEQLTLMVASGERTEKEVKQIVETCETSNYSVSKALTVMKATSAGAPIVGELIYLATKGKNELGQDGDMSTRKLLEGIFELTQYERGVDLSGAGRNGDKGELSVRAQDGQDHFKTLVPEEQAELVARLAKFLDCSEETGISLREIQRLYSYLMDEDQTIEACQVIKEKGINLEEVYQYCRQNEGNGAFNLIEELNSWNNDSVNISEQEQEDMLTRAADELLKNS